MREILSQYVEASKRAAMPHTATITQALASVDAHPGAPLPPAAVRLGRFLLARQGKS